ncbi:MAG: TraR/DksA C4-type zinc finger protein [Acidobacteriota bacterium]
MLTNRRRELQDDLQRRIRDGRTDHAPEVRDHYELSDDDIQEDIELALLQLKAETLMCIDQALARLERGKYGSCLECDDEISERRLRALPFAVRCQSCEETRERNGDTPVGAPRRRGASLFTNATT